jgi:ribonuclease BN (tRNA processing enzyme)
MLTLLGCRGTTPVSGEKYIKYGGNTPSVFVPLNEQECLIIDCGTGINKINFSDFLTYKKYHIFFTHLHWDHIIGLPTFKVLYNSEAEINIYVQDKSLDYPFLFIKHLFNPPYFPVSHNMLKADIRYNLVKPGGTYNFGRVKLTSMEGFHPNKSLVYKLFFDNFEVVFATDYEHSRVDSELIAFSKNAKYLIFDTTYLPEDFEGKHDGISKKGWGHSTYVHGVDFAVRADVKYLVLYHHNPEYDDDALDDMLSQSKKIFSRTICSHDGMNLE